MPKEVALITGASSGIGEVFAELCARDRCDLVLVARSGDKLQALADRLAQAHGIKTLVLPTDLAEPSAAQRIVNQVTAAGWSVNLLFNNAGFGGMGYFDEMPLKQHAEMLQVNVLALTELTRLLLPSMVAARSGHILNVASTAAFQPGPNAAVYYASKAYVRFFSEGLQEELAGTGVKVTCLAPGPTRTNFSEVAAMSQTLVFRYNAMDVQTVAEAGYRALRAGRTLVVPGWMNKLLQLSSKFSHWAIVKKVMKHMMQPLPPRGTR